MRSIKPREYGSTKAVVAEAFKQAGGAKMVSAFYDLGLSTVYGFTDQDAKGTDLSLDRARRLTFVNKVTAFAEDFCALAGGVFLSPEKVCDGEDLADLGGDIGHRMADVVAELLKAIADGNISESERLVLRAQTDKAIAVLVALRGRLMQGGEA